MVHVTRVYLVRHGRAAAGWDTDLDPGLDDFGRAQAEVTATQLATLQPMMLISSPLRRCQETAQFLSAKWNAAGVAIEPSMTEIPSPAGIAMDERLAWLRVAMAGSWTDLGSQYVAFRDSVVGFVSSQTCDTVIFSHFIAINAVIGRCDSDDRLVIDSLDNASVTIVETDGLGGMCLIERGRQADTLIR